MNPNEKARLIQAAQTTLAALQELPVTTPCDQCAEFRDGYCERWKADVPPEARETGCSEWVEPIPF